MHICKDMNIHQDFLPTQLTDNANIYGKYYTLILHDGICDSTREIETLTGFMPMNDKWVLSSSGRNMFIRFEIGRFETYTPGFYTKIHYGIELKIPNVFRL